MARIFKRKPKTTRRPKRRIMRRRVKKHTVAKANQLANFRSNGDFTLDPVKQRPMRFSRGALGYNTLVGANSSVAGFGTFSINDLSNVSEFINLFDMIKFEKVILTFTLINISGNNETLRMPKIYFRYNYDKGQLTSTPTLGYMQQLADVQVHQFSPDKLVCRFVVYPKFMVPAYYQSVTIAGPTTFDQFGYSYKKCPWLALDDTNTLSMKMLGYAYVVDYIPIGYDIKEDHDYIFKVKLQD